MKRIVMLMLAGALTAGAWGSDFPWYQWALTAGDDWADADAYLFVASEMEALNNLIAEWFDDDGLVASVETIQTSEYYVVTRVTDYRGMISWEGEKSEIGLYEGYAIAVLVKDEQTGYFEPVAYVDTDDAGPLIIMEDTTTLHSFAVPEPSSALLLLLGSAGLMLRRRQATPPLPSDG